MKNSKRIMLLTLTAAMALFMVACGKKESDSTSGASKKTEAVVSDVNVTEAPTATEAPVVQGETVKVEKKVIASSVAVVQILDKLGVAMVGVPTSSYELPKSVENATRIGGAMTPDMEVVASLEADIIVSVDSLSEDLKKQFDALKLENLFVSLSSYEGLKETIKVLGQTFQVEDKANALIASFDEKEKTIQEVVASTEEKSVLIIFGAGQSFMVASNDTYVGDLVKRVGGKNIIENAPASFSPIDMEYLADKNPDYILLMTHANPADSLKALQAEFETNKAWDNFDAVKNDRVIALESEYFGMSANLLAVDAMEKLANILAGK